MQRGRWSAPELMRLRELFPRTPTARLARLLGRSAASVERQARQMFGARRAAGPWTPQDDELLREAFGIHDVETIAWILGRPPAEVEARVEALRAARGGVAWSYAELAMLTRLFGTRRNEDLAVCLSRSVGDIERMAESLCLAKDKAAGLAPGRTMPRWSAGEVARLRELYSLHDNLAIARALGRSVASVANKACQLGLGKGHAALREMGRRNVARRRRG